MCDVSMVVKGGERPVSWHSQLVHVVAPQNSIEERLEVTGQAQHSSGLTQG